MVEDLSEYLEHFGVFYWLLVKFEVEESLDFIGYQMWSVVILVVVKSVGGIID